jgi:phosphoribosylaminoimidazole-succinocarboxamide synthase
MATSGRLFYLPNWYFFGKKKPVKIGNEGSVSYKKEREKRMAAKIPTAVAREFLFPDFPLIHRGKVRDTYALPNKRLRLSIATDRVSIFDFVLAGEVPQKGEVLTAMNAFWVNKLSEEVSYLKQDIIRMGVDIDSELPLMIRNNRDLQKRAVVAQNLDMIPVEAIVRGYITGSGWKTYHETRPNHRLCGHVLPVGLRDGDALEVPLFTPTNKAEEGHDEDMNATTVRAQFGETLEMLTLKLYQVARRVALESGIILADTKLEFGMADHVLTLGDERFTPDSSRFWLTTDWAQSRDKGTSPTSFDKQFVREWGKTVGIDKLNPLNETDLAYVHGLSVPGDVLQRTRQLYRYIFFLLAGKRLETFQREDMGIPTTLPPIEVILGSITDLEQAEAGLKALRECGVPFRLHVISCHRNPDGLRKFVCDRRFPENATIIAGAGKAAALPGVLASWLQYYQMGHVPVIGVAFAGDTSRATEAAVLSIEELPGRPVILDAANNAFRGSHGFLSACITAWTQEFHVRPAPSKPMQFDIKQMQAATV